MFHFAGEAVQAGFKKNKKMVSLQACLVNFRKDWIRRW